MGVKKVLLVIGCSEIGAVVGSKEDRKRVEDAVEKSLNNGQGVGLIAITSLHGRDKIVEPSCITARLLDILITKLENTVNSCEGKTLEDATYGLECAGVDFDVVDDGKVKIDRMTDLGKLRCAFAENDMTSVFSMEIADDPTKVGEVYRGIIAENIDVCLTDLCGSADEIVCELTGLSDYVIDSLGAVRLLGHKAVLHYSFKDAESKLAAWVKEV